MMKRKMIAGKKASSAASGRSRRVRMLGLATVTGFLGLFLIGIGSENVLEEGRLKREYETSALLWKRKLAEGLSEQEVQGIRNQEVLSGREYLSMEDEIHVRGSQGEVRIANDPANPFGCVITILRDSTGETLYESGLIEPGHYVEFAWFDGGLKKGHYPCTVLAGFYAENGEYAGETAWTVAVIIRE